jgi:hypothetical protein
MVKVRKKTNERIILSLRKKEAVWLMGLVQNCLGFKPSEEPTEHKRMRHNLFRALGKEIDK